MEPKETALLEEIQSKAFFRSLDFDAYGKSNREIQQGSKTHTLPLQEKHKRPLMYLVESCWLRRLILQLKLYRGLMPENAELGTGLLWHPTLWISSRCAAPSFSMAPAPMILCRPCYNSPRFQLLLDHAGSQQPQIREWRQTHAELLGCAGCSSAALAPGRCLNRMLHCPRSQQPQIQEWQQRHNQLLLLHLAAVSTECWIAPGHNSPRRKNGYKSCPTCLDLLDVSQLLLHLAAISTECCIAPGHNSPDSRMAAKARSVAWMCWTRLSCSCAWLLSPPPPGLPQVTTAPESRMAARQNQLLGCAGRSSDALAPGCCLHHNLHGPRSQHSRMAAKAR